MPSSDATLMTPDQYATFWCKFRQATAALSHQPGDDWHADITGDASELPIEPCTIFQVRRGLPASATWLTATPSEIDVSQTSLVATMLGVITDRLLIPSPTSLEVSIRIGKYLLSVRRINQYWAQSLFWDDVSVYKELLQMSRVAQILAAKPQ